jgi:hypothetical protein
MERTDAIRKLVNTFHLNVEERNLFSTSALTIEEVVNSISNILSEVQCYPTGWNAEDSYEGVFIEIKDGKILGTRKTEKSLTRYEILDEQTFSAPEAAARYAIDIMFNGCIDGIDYN